MRVQGPWTATAVIRGGRGVILGDFDTHEEMWQAHDIAMLRDGGGERKLFYNIAWEWLHVKLSNEGVGETLA